MDFADFKRCLPRISAWGAPVPSRVTQIGTAFDSIQDRRGGFVLFDALCEWALTQRAGGDRPRTVAGGDATSSDRPRSAAAAGAGRSSDPLLCYTKRPEGPAAPRTAWYLRSAAPGRYPVPGVAPTCILESTPSGLTVTSAVGAGSRRLHGGLAPELKRALIAEYQKLMSPQSAPTHKGRSKYLRYTDELTADVDPTMLERHRRARMPHQR